MDAIVFGPVARQDVIVGTHVAEKATQLLEAGKQKKLEGAMVPICGSRRCPSDLVTTRPTY